MTREEAWKAYVEGYEMEVPEDRVAEEIRCIRTELKHGMLYESMSGGRQYLLPELELERQKEEIRAAAYYEVKSELVMRQLMQQLDVPVTKEELEAEAAAMARRQNTTVERIKDFFGEELTLLERDVREQKILDWVCTRQ